MMKEVAKDQTSSRKFARMRGRLFWKSYWVTMRPYLLFISGAAGAVGLAHIDNQDFARTILAFMPLFFSYGLGQALTDCFQIDTDSLSSPYRPLVRGIISSRQVLIVSLIGLLFSVGILTYLNPLIIPFGILAVLGLLTYTKLKRTWWGGPPWNSWVVALLPIIGRLTEQDSNLRTIFKFSGDQSLSFPFSICAIFFAYANFVVMGYFKDISADRQTGYKTFPVVFGWLRTAIYSDILSLCAAAGSAMAILTSGRINAIAVLVFFIAAALNVTAQIKIHLTKSESDAHKPIANVVRAFLLYCFSIILALKAYWLVPLLAYYLIFELSLKYRPEQTQV